MKFMRNQCSGQAALAMHHDCQEAARQGGGGERCSSTPAASALMGSGGRDWYSSNTYYNISHSR